MMSEKFKAYLKLMRLDKPIGFYLLLWPTLWALWLASDGKPAFYFVLIFIAGVFVMRSAGCIINDMADRNIDGFVERTAKRPLATKKVSLKEAFIILFILLSMALGLVLLLNRLTLELALIGLFITFIYPFLKRITHLPQVGLGVAFSWGIPCSFAAITGELSFKAWVLFFPALLWPIIYDTLYAMADKKDDLKIGVKSTAILFAEKDKRILVGLQLLFIGLLINVGFYFQLNHWFYLSLLIGAMLFIYQQILIKDRIPAACFKAFLNNQWVGLSIFIGILLNYYL